MDLSSVALISADAHVEEPHDLWWDNLPKNLRNDAPRMIQAKGDGGWELMINGAPRGWGTAELERIQNLDADKRVEVMLSDGIAGECIFPTIGLYLWNMTNAEAAAACCRIYNDWIYDLLEKRSPRFRCAGVVPTWDIDVAVKEVEYIAEIGLGAVMLPLVGTPAYNDPRWEPLWTAIVRTGLPVVMHQGTGHDMVFHRGPGASVSNLLATQSMAPRTAGLLTTAGVFERHPDLHVVMVEVNASWIPWAMSTLDFYTDAFMGYGWVKPELPLKPSEYLVRNIHATFQDDAAAINGIPFTGARPLLWGSDYPHDEGTFPHSRDVVHRLFDDIAAEDAKQILGGTTAELFNFDLSQLKPVG
jgi:predicted TIM-barrel fold metal-dependent hydrolase